MTTLRKPSLFEWIFLLMLLAGHGCAHKTPPPIVVGHIATLSGPDKRAGIQAMQGVNLALEEVNKDAERRIQVVHTDAQGKVDAFESQAVRLLALNGARALLGGDTPEEVARLDRALQPETKDQPVFLPIISPCGWRPRPTSKHVILTGMTPQAEARVLARFAVEEKNVTQVSLLVDQADDRARTVADVFVREFVEARKKQSGKEPVKPRTLLHGADLPLSDALARLADNRPEAVLVAGAKSALRLAIEKLIDNIKPPGDGRPARDWWGRRKQPLPMILFSGPDGSLSPDDWTMLVRPGDEGAIYLASAFGLEKDNAAIDGFAQRFRDQFQEGPDVHAALAYEGMKLLADALRRSSDAAKLREELFKIKDFAGLAGPLNFDADQTVIRSLFVLRLARDQMVVMKKYAP